MLITCYCGTAAGSRPTAQRPDDTRVNTEQGWNGTDSGNPKNWEKDLSQCHFAHHKSHMRCAGREPRNPPLEPVTELPDPMA